MSISANRNVREAPQEKPQQETWEAATCLCGTCPTLAFCVFNTPPHPQARVYGLSLCFLPLTQGFWQYFVKGVNINKARDKATKMLILGIYLQKNGGWLFLSIRVSTNLEHFPKLYTSLVPNTANWCSSLKPRDRSLKYVWIVTVYKGCRVSYYILCCRWKWTIGMVWQLSKTRILGS